MAYIFHITPSKYRDTDLWNCDDFYEYDSHAVLGKKLPDDFPVMQLRVIGKGHPPDIMKYGVWWVVSESCLLYTSPRPRD